MDRSEVVAGCQVWRIDLRASDGEYERALSLLSGAERTRALAIRGDAARRRFVLARVAVRRRLGDALGMAPERVVLRIGEHGKPEIASRWDASRAGEHGRPAIAHPRSDAGDGSARVRLGPPRFNLAHSDGVALLAIHRRQDVGVDVERLPPPGKRPWTSLLERICHPSEAREAMAEGRGIGQLAFYERWVAKEAVLKALGHGLAVSPAEVSLRRDARGALRVEEFPGRPVVGAAGELRGAGGEVSSSATCRLADVRTAPGFVGALALVETASDVPAATIGSGPLFHAARPEVARPRSRETSFRPAPDSDQR